jgi:hypothetical protein
MSNENMNDDTGAGIGEGSLLEAVGGEGAAPTPAKPGRARTDFFRGGAIALAGVIVGAALAFGGGETDRFPESETRDPFGGSLKTIVFEDEFNRLPVQERIDLVRDLLDQMRNMDSGSSAMLASFAAGIREEARQQLQTNARRLMVDFMDMHAKRYAAAGASEREAMLDQSLREIVTLQRELFGMDASDEDVDEGVERARRDAKREQERAAENRDRLDSGEAAGFMRWAQREGADSDPNQRARVTLFMRDMTRHMRGQDLDTGKPK